MAFFAELGGQFFPFSGQNLREDDSGREWPTWLRDHDLVNHAVEIIGNIHEHPDLLEHLGEGDAR